VTLVTLIFDAPYHRTETLLSKSISSSEVGQV
jgi:hypothetical protein